MKNKNNKNETIFGRFSEEMILKIFSYLDFKNLLIAAMVSQGFNRLANDKRLMFGLFSKSYVNLKYDEKNDYKSLLKVSEKAHLKQLQITAKGFEDTLQACESNKGLHSFLRLFMHLAFSPQPEICNKDLPYVIKICQTY